MTNTSIKICGLTREEDVDCAVNEGVNAIGFVLYPKSERYVSAERAAQLSFRLPSFVSPVLLYVNASEEEIISSARQVPGAWLQFHGDETPEFCLHVAQSLGRRWIRAARIPESPPKGQAPFDLVKYSLDYSQANALLIDTHVEGYGGGGKTFNWSLLPLSVNAHLVLSGGLRPANVGDGICALHARGLSLAVDVSSGVESAKGIKDPHKIRQFVKAVRSTVL
ncbi:MAG: phosphoribosylanthranilate isomerase [Limnohabitans sp.]|nr:phosphoribosylanthranilate isomerase [Limnohabitans sp.]